ncbi:MAG TPA: amino acid ABC transporter substrate-binding protein [Burkholderiales bacterium]|nr:amino acid ABC transporter substrate-binding protein [Burkholderiales bacterium]
MKGTMLVFAVLVCALAGPAAAQTGALDRIRSSGVITLGYIEGGAPFSFVGEDKQPQGYSVDLCREVALGIRTQLKLAKLETRWVALTIQDRLEAVRSGRVDLECSTTTWTLARQAIVDFSLITFVDGGSILMKSGTSLGRLLDFDGKRVAVITGTTTEKVLREALVQRSIRTEVVTVKTRPEGLKLLEDGRVDGFAADRTTLIALVLGAGAGSFRLLDEDFSVEPYALTLPRGDYEFRLAVNRVLARLYRSSEIVSIYNRWLGRLGPPSLLLSTTYFVQGLAD